MLITKTVKIKPYGNSVKFYKEKGYNAKHGVELEVDIKDIPIYSRNIFVETTCDYCGKLKDPISYENYNKTTNNGIEKCCCVDCAKFKREETMLKKYGNKNPMQVPEIKEKIQKTNLKKYGSNSPSGNSEVRAKQKKTLMKNYGVENPSQSEKIKQKIKETNLERYGVENVFLNNDIKEKIQQTIFERYGVDNVSKNKDIQHKKEQTVMEHYGVLYPLQNKECLEKMKHTNLKKYGVENVLLVKEIKQKAKNTLIDKYGVDVPSKSEEIKQRIRETNLERYGVEYPMLLPSFHEHARQVDMEKYGVYHHLQNPEILAKQKETYYKNSTCPTSKQQRYLYNIYGGELNFAFYTYNLDIYLPEDKINIEYNGSGHTMSVSLGSISQESFDRREIIRNTYIKNANIKQMRIVSTKDLLPFDQILLRMLSEAKQYFSQYPNHSWIEYNIDTSIVRNAEQKDGVFFDYGELRKIKDSDLTEKTA